MLSLLRSSAPLALTLATVALGSTGCAAKLGGTARLSLPSPSVSAHGYGNASAQFNPHAQGNASAQFNPQVQGNASAQFNPQAYGNASAQFNPQVQGNASAQFNPQAQGNAQAQYGGSCETAVATPAPPPQPWRPAPVFYGVPLENAQDVVFVLDRSGSMTEADSGAPMGLMSPTVTLSALAAAGSSAASSFRIPTSAAALGASTSAFAGFPGIAQNVLTARQTKLDIAKAELTGAIAGLPDGTRYNVVFFGSTVSELSPSLVSLNAMTRIGSMVFVQSIAPDGMTAAVPALRVAYASHPRRVVFLSDGLANVDGDGSVLLAEARVQMSSGVRFDTVGVGADQDRPLMLALAQQSGGISTSR